MAVRGEGERMFCRGHRRGSANVLQLSWERTVRTVAAVFGGGERMWWGWLGRGRENGLQLSAATRDALEAAAPGRYVMTERGDVDIKGKGLMHLYWLTVRSPKCFTTGQF